MHASDLAVELPLLPRSSSISETFKLIADHDLLAVVITGDDGRVEAIASPVEITRLVLPGYVLDDLVLAGLLDDASLAELFAVADARTVGEAIDAGDLGVRGVPAIDADASLLEIACHMIAEKAQIMRIREDGDVRRFVSLPSVLDALLASRTETGA
jgi:CBS domain-containing protein